MTRLALGGPDHGTMRRIALDGQEVDYRLVRTRRRTIGMEIDLDGLTVRAPRWVTIAEIEGALRERGRWIVRTLASWRGRRRDVLPRVWQTGAPIVYQGRELALAVFPSRKPLIRADLFDLAVLHPQAPDESRIATAVGHWLREEAQRLCLPRVAHYAAALGRGVPPVRLSNARSEWGSCNHRGEIRLNWRLAQLPPALADYVVAHEVAHLVELNHSPRFWSVVERLLPGHAAHRRALDDWTALLSA
ncbi:MAG TPA: SprT family zinc-dependent metalloprotease [Casimicrobiaceae bacterium]|nr:SprT family zinc-dependent metalloprotease [Casimicrobiaceae bacterium]